MHTTINVLYEVSSTFVAVRVMQKWQLNLNINTAIFDIHCFLLRKFSLRTHKYVTNNMCYMSLERHVHRASIRFLLHLFIYLLFYVTFNSQGHIETGSLLHCKPPGIGK